MSGIAGLMKMRRPVTPEASEAVGRMTQAQIYQRPNGSGVYPETVDYQSVRFWQAAHGQRGRHGMGDLCCLNSHIRN